MRQYLNTHEQVPDAILFYRLGDFYEMFFDDAKTASRELDLVLTGRNCGLEEKAPMCGVPYHSADTYIARLVEKGYKVAICEQVEDPKTAKGLVKREIQRIISPGTLMEEKMLKADTNNYLMCIYYNRNEYGVAYCDLSTGEFSVSGLKGERRDSQFISLLARLGPAQIMANTLLFEDRRVKKSISDVSDAMIEPYPMNYFYYDRCENTILDQFRVYSLSAVGLDDDEIMVRAAGALLRYLSETQKKTLIHINEIKINEDRSYMHLDYNTKRNLEIVENLSTNSKRDTLLDVIDHTMTPMGAREIRKWVLQPLKEKDAILNRQNAVTALIKNPDVMMGVRDAMKDIRDMERIMSRLSMDVANARDLLAVKQSLSQIPKIRKRISLITEDSALLALLYSNMDELTDITALIEDAIDDECVVTLKNGGIIKKGFDKEIDELNDLKKNSSKILSDIERKEKEKTGIKNLKIKYNRVFGYFLEVTSSYSNLVPDYFIRKQTLANSERYFTEELKDIETKLLSVEESLKEKEYAKYLEVRSTVLESIVRIQKTSRAVAVVDALSSMAEAARKYRYIRPVITTDGAITIKGGRHPVVERITGPDNFINNDTVLDNDENRMLIITGANMAGKSTYIRQVALICIMAQMGSYIPADSASISIVDRVFTRVGASDDLARGQSTFMVEMSEVSNILKYSTKDSLVILDEVGRGTSTFDGLSIANAVIEYLLDKEKVGAKTLFATHYHELTELEEKNRGVKNYSIRLESNEDGIVFLRKIERGGIDKSYGIEVAKLAGLPDEVIDRSIQILEILEDNEEDYRKKIDSIHSAKRPESGRAIQMMLGDDLLEDTKPERATNRFVEEIKELTLDTMSPMEVMNWLYDLKKRIDEEEN